MTKTASRRFTDVSSGRKLSHVDQERVGIMFELGPEKLLMMLLICLVLFGGKRIPEIGGAIGKGVREFKRGMTDIGDAVNEPVRSVEIEQEPKRLT